MSKKDKLVLKLAAGTIPFYLLSMFKHIEIPFMICYLFIVIAMIRSGINKEQKKNG